MHVFATFLPKKLGGTRQGDPKGCLDQCSSAKVFDHGKQPWYALMPPRCDTYRFLLRFLREVSSPSSQLHSGSAPLSWGGKRNSVCVIMAVHAHSGTPSVTNQHCQHPPWSPHPHRATASVGLLPHNHSWLPQSNGTSSSPLLAWEDASPRPSYVTFQVFLEHLRRHHGWWPR